MNDGSNTSANPAFDPVIAQGLREASLNASRGDFVQARKRAELLQIDHSHIAVSAFLGMICCRIGDFSAGAIHFREALSKSPGDISLTINLAMALMDSGSHDEALDLCSRQNAERDPSKKLWRFRAFLMQSREDYVGATEAYEHVVAAMPDDFDSWNNLGNARAACQDYAGSVIALEQAIKLRPDVAPARLNHASALIDAERIDDALAAYESCIRDFPNDAKPLIEYAALLRPLDRPIEALAALETASAIAPDDPDIHVRVGEARVEAKQVEQAENAFLAALTLDKAHPRALIQLAMFYEYANRVDDLKGLFTTLNTRGADQDTSHFIEALICRRDQDFTRGLELLKRVPETLEPVRRYQLEGEFRERTDDAAGAFAAFTRVNELLLEEPNDPAGRAESYLTKIAEDRAIVTKPWFDGWLKTSVPAELKPPVFLVGFPRSGTTLLDTMLMGHPDIQVMEEQPPLRAVERELGSIERLATLTDNDIAYLRTTFYDDVRKCIEFKTQKLLVDKFPLHLNKVALIHRLFPDAKFILALRHPCDVVLSCYITSFRLNNAMSNFLTLENCAKAYDLTFGNWEQCRAIMPINVHTVYYERMIENVEAELKPMFEFLGCDWRAEATDHQRTAANRGAIRTASYSQVTEPIYQRAVARWGRYRDQLAPVLPTLAPWVEKFGYRL